MGFLGIFKSIEDLLYEVMTWLVFYPRTLWQVLRHPLETTAYSDTEQTETATEQYTDTLSPPIFLMLTILIGHAIELALEDKSIKVTGALARLVNNSEESLLVFRLILFSIFPLMFALAVVKRSDKNLDRKTLRGPFFSQCYIAAVYSLLLSTAIIAAPMSSVNGVIAAGLILLFANVWYLAIETKIVARSLSIGNFRAFGISLVAWIKAIAINGAVSAIFLT